MKPVPLSYLPHIDGLRTLAVLSVFLFHLDANYLPGGFLGVDVFFVISGFLITMILKREAEAGYLNAADFYARRIRRLFPALFVVMIFCFLVATFRYSPEKLVELAQSGIAAIFSVSNFYFYFNDDYFDAAAKNQIFLHTWSLAVEEQFYLIWPLIIFLLIKYFSKSWQIMLVIGVCLTGTVASYLGTMVDASMAFYMMPFRIAEFGLGSILCWLPRKTLPFILKESLVLLAIATILGSFIIISDQYLFPSLWFLIPCIATSLLIYLGDSSRITGYVLANPVSTYIGRVSYSLYLFHWPVIVLYKNEAVSQIALSHQMAIFMTTTLLAVATYHLVEQPLRRAGTIWPSNRAVALTFALSVALVTLSFFHIIREQGFLKPIPVEIRSHIEEVEPEKLKRFEAFRKMCKERGWKNCSKPSDNKPNVLIIGDSHGIDALNALQPVWPSFHFIMHTKNSCPPMTLGDFEQAVKRNTPHYETCLMHTKSLSESSLFKRAEMIVISARYSWYSPEMLDRFLASLKRATGVPVIVFGQAPVFSKALPDILYHHQQFFGLETHAFNFLEKETWKFEASLMEVAAKNNGIFIPKAGYFCERKSNRCKIFYGDSRKLLTYDEHHLSIDSAAALGEWLSKKLPDLPKKIEDNHLAKKN